jgi:peptidoglycan/xylan/chitin deacetylase (PgdA/CDA1 family)
VRQRLSYYLSKILLAAAISLLILDLIYVSDFHHSLAQWLVFKRHWPAILSLVAAFLYSFITYYEYHGIGPQEGVYRRGPSNKPQVAITFDDGPSPIYTPAILDILKKKQAPATFFLVGKHVQKYPQIAQRICQEGHEIGNHTYSHRDLVPATRRTVIKEINQAELVFKTVLKRDTNLFRPPRGIYGNAVRKLLLEMGYTIVLWNVSAADWSGLSPKRIVRRVKRFTRNGGIILFHDSGAIIRSEGASRGNTVEALPLVIDKLRRYGFEIVPLSTMLGDLDYLDRESEEVVTEIGKTASQEA